MAGQDMKFSGEIFRKNHPIILSTNRHLATILPVRLQYDAAGYSAGEVIARQTSGAASGTHLAYDDNASSGINVAVGILMEDIPVEAFPSSTGTQVARAIFGGEVFEDKLVGLDAAAKVDLKSRSIVDATGTTILKF